MKYQLPNEHICWHCNHKHRPSAELNAQIVEWICEKCGSKNIVIIDLKHFKIGHRLFLAAVNYLNKEEPDIAAILLYSAVDATLARGIFELENWKFISKGQRPPNEKDIEKKLSRMNIGQKVECYQNLTNNTVDNLIADLFSDENYKHIFQNVSLKILQNEFEKIATERHKIMHYGKSVDKKVILLSLPCIQRILIILELMFEKTYKNI